VFNSGPAVTDVIIDMNGFYPAPTDLSGNTAIGSATLAGNTTGYNNTAAGEGALQFNTSGTLNTAIGQTALQANTIGTDNTAAGQDALLQNTSGDNNTAVGGSALQSNTTGSDNIAIGFQALTGTSSGSGNIAIGVGAGFYVGNGNNNIDIGNGGGSNESNVTRIGSSQASFFAAGIRTVTTGQSNAVPVLVDSNGQLGTINSSARFKEDIQDMGDASSRLLRLRPVTFRYKQPYEDGSKPIDYGLIAEEVAQVLPDLAVKGVDGQFETVQYQKLTPMLLNEVQKQNAQLQKQDLQLQEQNAKLLNVVQLQHEENGKLEEQNRKLEDRLAALEALLAATVAPPAGIQ